MQAQSESEGHPQKDGQPQRIDGDPYAEMHKTTARPRDFGISWNIRREYDENICSSIL